MSSCQEPNWSPKNRGYTTETRNGIPKYIHVWVWLDWMGHIPAGYEIHHTCQNPRCVNLTHLECIPAIDNKRYGAGWTKEDGHWHCKRGHLMEGWNVYIASDGGSRCKACKQENQRKRKRDSIQR